MRQYEIDNLISYTALAIGTLSPFIALPILYFKRSKIIGTPERLAFLTMFCIATAMVSFVIFCAYTRNPWGGMLILFGLPVSFAITAVTVTIAGRILGKKGISKSRELSNSKK